MLRALKAIWRTLVGIKDVVITTIVIGLLVMIIMGLFSDKTPVIQNGSMLALTIDGYIVEQATTVDPVELAAGLAELPLETQLRDVLEAIDRAAGDEQIAGMTLELDQFYGAGPADLESLSAALRKFRDSGKPIYAYAQFYTEPQYALASHATDIWLHPMGSVFLTGYGQYGLYFKGALDKLAVTVNVFRSGRYKSFIEPFTRADMSEEARQAARELYDTLWASYVSNIRAARQTSGFDPVAYAQTFQTAVTQRGGDIAQVALDAGAVDQLGTPDAFRDEMISRVGEQEDEDGLTTYRQVDLYSYLAATSPGLRPGREKVGVVYVNGSIVDGEAPTGTAGADTVARHLAIAAQSDEIKAVVLRVNSPGGTVTGGERIREAVMAVQATGKPVVVSMGTVAASAGYWISAGGDEIFAQPSTITGSIGVFGVLPTFENTLGKLGVTSDGVGTTPLAGFGDLSQPLSDASRLLLQSGVDRAYDMFLEVVSTGRKKSKEAVDEIAQGRVWSGSALQDFGLLDALGGLDEAISAAARRADLTEFDTVYVEEELPWEAQIAQYLFQTHSAARRGAHNRQNALGGSAGLASGAPQIAALFAGAQAFDAGWLQSTCLECLAFTSPAPAFAQARTGWLSRLASTLQTLGN